MLTVAVALVAAAMLLQETPPFVELCHWYVIPVPALRPLALKLKLTPAHGLAAEEAAVPALGVPEHPVGTGWVRVMSSSTTQQSGVVPTMVAFTRTNREAPAAGVNVRLAVWQLVLEALLNVVPAVVQGPLAAVAHSTVKVTEFAGVAPPVEEEPVYCCTL